LIGIKATAPFELSHINANTAVTPQFARQIGTRGFLVEALTMSSKDQQQGRRPLVAIVDDDQAVCGSLKFALELEGFAVRTFSTAEELLRDTGLEACDCFVIDQRMPVMSGMELIAALRKRRIMTPAILLTGHPSTTLSARAHDTAIPVVEKPLFGNTLVDLIRETCRRD
jgi:FixJ family two-component response regulator